MFNDGLYYETSVVMDWIDNGDESMLAIHIHRFVKTISILLTYISEMAKHSTQVNQDNSLCYH